MVKKKQPDFQKAKLKPGRILPKGKNVTNTAFKSKKIIINKKVIKGKSDLTIQECLKNACRNTSPNDAKKDSLSHLKNLIVEQEDTFYIHIHDIITGMKQFIFDTNDDLNYGALKVLDAVLLLADEIQISSHLPYLINLIECGLTHTEMKVKGASLRLLDILMNTHPLSSMGHYSISFLENLQSLLSGPSYNTKSRKKNQNSTLIISYGNTFYSQDWRFQVLAHMNMILVALVENIKKNEDDKYVDLEKEVHWNSSNGPLYLELYAGGGKKPIDIEKFDSSKFKSPDYDLEDPQKVHEFVDGIMDVFSQIFIEEITDGTAKADDDLILTGTISNLNILFQVLRAMGEWVMILNNTDCEFEVDMKKCYAKSLNDKIFKNISKFPFIPRGTAFEHKPHYQHKFLPCVQLNLSVCYLFTTFIMKPEPIHENFRSHVLNYVAAALKMPYEVRCDSLPLILKMVKIYMAMREQYEVVKPKELSEMLSEMVKTLKLEDDRPCQRQLFEFFIDMSLEVGPGFQKTSGRIHMSQFYTRLLQLFEKMAETNIINKPLLQIIRTIAVRKHPIFLECLFEMKIHTIKGLLLHGNQDIRETCIFLIYNMPLISLELLEELSDVILGPYFFPQKYAIMMIQLITSKFTDSSASSEDRVIFVEFLINLAIDSINIDNERWLNYNLPDFEKAWIPCSQVVPYRILPSFHWKEHSKLFEACYDSLNQFPPATINTVVRNIVCEVMSDNRNKLPIHTTIALLKINNPDIEGTKYNCIIENLTYASIFFISVFTSFELDDEWYEWNVSHLMKSLPVNQATSSIIVKHLEYDAGIEKEGIVVHYILRIIQFLASVQLIHLEEKEKFLNLLEELKINCIDKDIDRQPLFVKIYDIFNYSY